MSDVVYRSTVLDNGFEVHTARLPETKRVYLEVRVKSGSGAERPGEYGAAHYLEHMFAYGSPDYPHNLVMQAAQKGGNYNFATGLFDTDYWASCLSRKIPAYLDGLYSILSNPSFTSEHVETERNPIQTEALKVYNKRRFDPIANGWQMLFPHHRFSEPIIGTREDIGSMSYEQLRNFYEDTYTGPNMFLVAVGDVDHDWYVDYCRSTFASFPARTPNRHLERPMFKEGAQHRFLDVEGIDLAIGFDLGPRRDLKTTMVYGALGSILLQKLHNVLREEKKMVYEISAEGSYLQHSGQLVINTSLMPELQDAVQTEIFQTLADFPSGILQEDIDFYLAALEEGIEENRLNTGRYGDAMANEIQVYGTHVPLSQGMEVLGAMDLEEFRTMARGMFTGRAFMLAIGQTQEDPDFGRIKKLKEVLGIDKDVGTPYMGIDHKPNP